MILPTNVAMIQLDNQRWDVQLSGVSIGRIVVANNRGNPRPVLAFSREKPLGQFEGFPEALKRILDEVSPAGETVSCVCGFGRTVAGKCVFCGESAKGA